MAPVGSFSLVLPSSRSSLCRESRSRSRPPVSCLVDQRGIGLWRSNDNLGQAVSVSQVNEDGATVIAFAFHPAAQGDFRSDIFFAELTAVVGA